MPQEPFGARGEFLYRHNRHNVGKISKKTEPFQEFSPQSGGQRRDWTADTSNPANSGLLL